MAAPAPHPSLIPSGVAGMQTGAPARTPLPEAPTVTHWKTGCPSTVVGVERSTVVEAESTPPLAQPGVQVSQRRMPVPCAVVLVHVDHVMFVT